MAGGRKRKAGEEAPQRGEEADLSLGQDLKGFGQSVLHGLSAGFFDDLIAKLGPGGKERAARWEQNREAFERQHRNWAIGGEIAGGVGSFALGGGALQGVGRLAQGTKLAAGLARTAGGARTVAAGAAGAARAVPGVSRVMAAARPTVQAATTAVQQSPRLSRAAQAVPGLGRRTIESTAIGTGFGGAMAAGEAESGEKWDAAKRGAKVGAMFGAAMPAGLSTLGFVGGHAAQLAGGRISPFLDKMRGGRLLGGADSPAAGVIAREEAASRGGLNLLASVARLPRRAIEMASGRGSVTAAPELAVARKMLHEIKTAYPDDFKQVIAQIRAKSGDTFKGMDADEVWLRVSPAALEAAGGPAASRAGTILATETPQIAADVASAAGRVVGRPEVSGPRGLLAKAAQTADDLTQNVISTVEGWAGKLTGGRAGGSGRSYRARVEQRGTRANELYGKLDEFGVAADDLQRINRVFIDDQTFASGGIGKELEKIYQNIVKARNFDDELGRMKPLAKRVGVDGEGNIIPLQEALAGRGGQQVLRTVGQVEDFLRAIGQMAEGVNPKSFANQVANTGDRAAFTTLNNLKTSVTRVLDDISDEGVKVARLEYGVASGEMRAFERGQELAKLPSTEGTLEDLADAAAEVRRTAPRGRGERTTARNADAAADAFNEGYVNQLLDKARRAASEGGKDAVTPEGVIVNAREYLAKLFPKKDVDELVDALRTRVAPEREGLVGIGKARATAAAAEESVTRQALEGATFGVAAQWQAFLRTVNNLVNSGYSPAEARRLATVRLGMNPRDVGRARLADVARYDQMRAGGQRRVGQGLGVAGGLLGSDIGTPSGSPTGQARRRRGLLDMPPLNPRFQLDYSPGR
tara:strand:+ start:1515 stop:4118 length:2604 start_codon:yes stop_codon:yes gene_type:complete